MVTLPTALAPSPVVRAPSSATANNASMQAKGVCEGGRHGPPCRAMCVASDAVVSFARALASRCSLSLCLAALSLLANAMRLLTALALAALCSHAAAEGADDRA